MRVIICSIFVLLSMQTSWAATATHWRTLAPGLSYTQLSVPGAFQTGAIHAFKINLKKYQLHMAMAHEFNAKVLSARSFANQSKSLLAINGGFFSPNARALGLRHDLRGTHSRLKPTRWWSVFYIQNDHARIRKLRRFIPSSKIQFAIQAGPRLLIHSQIPRRLKKRADDRSAIAINRKGEVVLLVTAHAPMRMAQLAMYLKRPEKQGGLGCTDALNLDGGSSSQLYAQVEDFNLSVPNFSRVTDAIIVRRHK